MKYLKVELKKLILMLLALNKYHFIFIAIVFFCISCGIVNNNDVSERKIIVLEKPANVPNHADKHWYYSQNGNINRYVWVACTNIFENRIVEFTSYYPNGEVASINKYVAASDNCVLLNGNITEYQIENSFSYVTDLYTEKQNLKILEVYNYPEKENSPIRSLPSIDSKYRYSNIYLNIHFIKNSLFKVSFFDIDEKLLQEKSYQLYDGIGNLTIQQKLVVPLYHSSDTDFIYLNEECMYLAPTKE